MKKVLSIVLAIAMIATMSVVAFANSAEGEAAAPTGSKSFDVEATFAPAAHVDKYKVDVKWETAGFTYTEAATVWNTADHKWTETQGASWAGSGTITVKNHSSKGVIATPSFVAVEDGNVEMDFEGNGTLVLCPENATEQQIPTATFTATITAGSIAATGKIGTITVAIA